MLNKKNFKNDRIINLGILLFAFFAITIFINNLDKNSYFVIISFLLFNAFISFFPKEIRLSMPMIIIRITGLARYVLIPIVIATQKIDILYTDEMLVIIILELCTVIISTFIFWIINKNKYVKYNKEKTIDAILKVDIFSLLVIIIGTLSFLYVLIVNLVNGKNANINGGIAIVLACFFLIIYVECLIFIKRKLKVSDAKKIIISAVVSFVFIYFSSKTGNNISRWTIIITGIISYIFMSKLYSNYAKKMLTFLLVVLVFSITFASALKFALNPKYNTIGGIVEDTLSFNTLNAYFSGPKNMKIGLELKNDINNLNVPKIKLFLNDTFGNFPVLNRYVGDRYLLSSSMFNYRIYGTTKIVDQIIPYSCQLYNFFGVFFILLELIQIYLAYYFYFTCRKENNFLRIYYCIYLSFYLSLFNCINYSIIMQTLWINVLPIFVICYLKKNSWLKSGLQ